MYLVSIVVPTYNSFSKMDDTLRSLEAVSVDPRVEVILVDDCSRDSTFDQLQSIANARQRWRIMCLAENSGSAAAPRNTGLDSAQGEFVFFLDSDDALLTDNFLAALDYLDLHKPDMLRTPLLRLESDGREQVLDRIQDFGPTLSVTQKIRQVVHDQSLTVSCFFRRSLLAESGLRFDQARRIGEDITFTARALALVDSLDYYDLPIRTYRINAEGSESITQSINSEQFVDFIKSWEDVEEALAPHQVSFLAEHGFSAVQYALRQYVWFRSEPMDPDNFAKVARFFEKYWPVISEFPLPQRLRDIAEAALDGSLERFNAEARTRLLIAGHDLKFLEPLNPLFEGDYSVRRDVWTGHTGHDEAESLKLLDWADLIWAEWMLGAAVWYSERITSRQRMVIRAHRSEMTVAYGESVALDKVSAILTVAPHCLRDFADRFDLPPEKMRLTPIGFDVASYERGTDPERVFRLAMVGALPKLKGLRRALEMLSQLRRSDERFTLTIYGRRPQDLPWLWNQPKEREYYESCDLVIQELGLHDHVAWGGWIDPSEQLAQHGVVVSMSDVEGMQVSPAEGFCAGAVGLFLNWRGVEDIYPPEFIFSDIRLMASYILDLREPDALDSASSRGRTFIEQNYGLGQSWEEVSSLLKMVRA